MSKLPAISCVFFLLAAGISACSYDSSAIEKRRCSEGADSCLEGRCIAGICVEGNDLVADLPSVACDEDCAATEACCEGVCTGIEGSPYCGACGTACAEAERCCAGQCVNVDFDDAHCGGCAQACAVNESCGGGSCLCLGGFGDCTPLAGCETPLELGENCPFCSEACKRCVDGRCECLPSFRDCANSGDCQTNLSSDPAHCGACFEACEEPRSCVDGQCRCGSELCDGVAQVCCHGGQQGSDVLAYCLNESNNPDECGGCGMPACRSNERCVDGRCVCGTLTCGNDEQCCGTICSSNCNCEQGCLDGEFCCDGTCSPLGSEQNCLACGDSCALGASCTEGGCQCPIATQKICSNVCIETATDTQNCGDCARDCSACADCKAPAVASASCEGGKCSYQCAPGYATCDGLPGCTNLATLNHCGTCFKQCPPLLSGANGDSVCTSGQCGLNCAPGYFNCDGNLNNGCESTVSCRFVGDYLLFYEFADGPGLTADDTAGVFDLHLDATSDETPDFIWGSSPSSLGVVEAEADTMFRSGNADAVVTRLKDSKTFTLEVWLEASELPASPARHIVSFGGGPGNTEVNLALMQEGSSVIAVVRESGKTHVLTVAGQLAVGELAHFAIVFQEPNSPKGLWFYKNGVQIDFAELQGDTGAWSNYTFCLFSDDDSSRQWLGKLYLVVLYERALSATQVSRNFWSGVQ